MLQQLGPAPPATASPGMVLQYNTMFKERRQSLIIDKVCSVIENAAALMVKVRHQAHPCAQQSLLSDVLLLMHIKSSTVPRALVLGAQAPCEEQQQLKLHTCGFFLLPEAAGGLTKLDLSCICQAAAAIMPQ